MKKKNVYCKGGPDFAKVYEKIKEKGLISGSIDSSHLLKERYEFGSSEVKDNILFSSMNYWSRDGSFTEVNPHEFSEIWLGYDCLEKLTKEKVFCKGGPDTQKVIEEMAKHIDKMIVDGQQIRISKSDVWGRTNVTVGLSAFGGNIAYSDDPRWFPENDYTEVDVHTFSVLWLGYDCLTSSDFDKGKIYCHCGSDFKKVIAELVKHPEKLIYNGRKIDVNPDCYMWDDNGCFAGLGTSNDTRITYCHNSEQYSSHGYKRVTPSEFSIAWLGYDCLISESLKRNTTFCKGSPELLKVLTVCKKKGIAGNYPTELMASNPDIEFSKSICREENYIGYSEMHIYSKQHARTEIDAHQFSILWLGYDCLEEKDESAEVYVEETHKIPADEPEIPFVVPTKKNFKIIL